MSLTMGDRIGAYEILDAIGAGGMGEVYRARDTKLDRDIALKVLPDTFAFDPERVARFKREAQVLASLNHPNIAQIYGLEEGPPAAGPHVRALVLELVDGPTLAERLELEKQESGGGLPLDEALSIARQIAEALEAAHEQGIVHRDLKPANVKLRPDGTVKVLDFGLAKLVGPAEAGPYVRGDGAAEAGRYVRRASPQAELTQSPTISTPAMTAMGVILGTAAYMSPEQAKGRPADKRSDVWAFGCVLYEMLTGKRAFEGDDVSDTLAAILRGEPDWSALPAGLPASIRTLLERCLEKDRRKRIADTSTALFVIREPSILRPPVRAPAPASSHPRPLWHHALPIVATTVVAVAAGAASVWRLQPRPSAFGSVTRFSFAFEAAQEFYPGLAISPDGSQVVYTANQQLYRRAMSNLEARPIQGSEIPQSSNSAPVFSPDGKWIAFIVSYRTVSGIETVVRKIAVAGGAPVTICPLAIGGGVYPP